MADQYRVITHGSDAKGTLGTDAAWNLIGYLASGHVVADGITLDLRGATGAASVRAWKTQPDETVEAAVELRRSADGDHVLHIEDVDSSVVSSQGAATALAGGVPIRGGAGALSQTVRSTAAESITVLGGLEAEAEKTRQQFGVWERAVADVAHFFDPDERVIVDAALSWARRGLRGVVLSSHWTTPQKLVFLAQSRLGPSGFTLDPDLDVAAANLLNYIRENKNTITRPTDRIVFCDPTTGTRIATDQLVEESVAIRANMAAEATDQKEYVQGTWSQGLDGKV